MNRPQRQLLIRFVMVAGVLVTLGTGDYDPPKRTAEADTELLPGSTTRIRIVANQDALRAGGSFYVTVTASGKEGVDTTLRFTPEQFEQDVSVLVLRAMNATTAGGAAGSGDLVTDDDAGHLDDDAGVRRAAGAAKPGASALDLLSSVTLGLSPTTCEPMGSCERTYRVERMDSAGDSGEPLQLLAQAIIEEQYPDRVFCSSPVPRFGKDAAVMVAIDE